ncbi:MAG: hypothetical protein GY849_21910 [Deltaproteobacteria bacterium]|nr:hypothetical protein [Deltaproteobacteria bacterium]
MNIKFNDCIFDNAAIIGYGTVSATDIEINYSTFTSAESEISAGTSTANSAVYTSCEYGWTPGTTHPELSAININNIKFDDYDLSSTLIDRESTWLTSAYNYGFYGSLREGAGAFNFDNAGHIGAFFFGVSDSVAIVPDALEVTTELLDPTILISDNIDITSTPLNVFLELLEPTIYSYEDIVVDFYAVPTLGVSPLDVGLSATVQVLGEFASTYEVSAYEWFFDFDIDTSISASTLVPTTEYTFSGYSGRQFSVKLNVTFTTGEVRSKYKELYITVCGQEQPIRVSTDRMINLTNFLSDYQKETEFYSLVEIFENYLNTMYSGNKSYTYTEEDL